MLQFLVGLQGEAVRKGGDAITVIQNILDLILGSEPTCLGLQGEESSIAQQLMKL